MQKKLQTPSQTIGPYFAYGLTPEQYAYDFDSWTDASMVEDTLDENVITIVGKVLDGNGEAIDDAMLELWQNDANGKRFGRYGTGTDPQNRFFFKTLKPLAQDGQAPFISVILFMRGQLTHSFTRIYFSDEEELNNKDKVFLSVPEERRHTLIAHKKGQLYEFNIFMQGEKETVFFDI